MVVFYVDLVVKKRLINWQVIACHQVSVAVLSKVQAVIGNFVAEKW